MEQPKDRTRRRNGQALNICHQIIQIASLQNRAVSAKDIYNIVSTNKRMSNKGEFSFSSVQSFRKFLSIGYNRSLWERKKILITGWTGSTSVFYYYFPFHVDVDTMDYGIFPDKWTRNKNGDYVLAPVVLNSQTNIDGNSE